MPETIGVLVLSAAGVSTIAGFTVTASTFAIVGNTVLAAAAIGLSYALSPTQAGTAPQDGQIITRQSLPDRRRNYGLVKVAGPLIFSESLGGRRYQVIALNQGKVDAFLHHFFAENEGAIDTDGSVINLYTTSDGKRWVYIFFENGTDSDPAFDTLLAIFPSIWTSAHQGKGIAKVLIMSIQPKSSDFTTVYPGGQSPVYRGVIQSSQVWDPRDPAQDKDDPSTWRYSTNAVLVALDFHRHADGMGLAINDSTFFTDAAINEDWVPAAQICDELVPLKNGQSILRYQACGSYALSDTPKDVLTAILATCDGQTYQRSDGAIGIRVGKIVAPTVTISDEHILGYESFHNGPVNSLIPVNQIDAKYTDIEIDFQNVAADPLQDIIGIAENGRAEKRSIDLLWVPEHAQARRLMKLAMRRANPDWSGRVITDLDGLRAWGERYINLVISELGINGTFELTAPPEYTIATQTVVLTVASFGQSAFDWDPATEEGTAPTVPDPGTTVDVINAPTDLALVSTSGRVIVLSWDPPTRLDLVADSQYSVHDADNWFDASVNALNDGSSTPVIAAGSYDVRVRFSAGTNPSAWVPLIAITVS